MRRAETQASITPQRLIDQRKTNAWVSLERKACPHSDVVHLVKASQQGFYLHRFINGAWFWGSSLHFICKLGGTKPSMPMALCAAGRRGTACMSRHNGKVKFKRPRPPERFWVVFGYIWRPAVLVGSPALPGTPKLQDFWAGPCSCPWDGFLSSKSCSCTSAQLECYILNTMQGGKVASSCSCRAPWSTLGRAEPWVLRRLVLQAAILLRPASRCSQPGARRCFRKSGFSLERDGNRGKKVVAEGYKVQLGGLGCKGISELMML